MHHRRKWLAAVLAVILSSGTSIGSARAGVPLATDLQREGRQAEQACMPLLLEFSAKDCGYCTLLEEEILNPTLLNRDYDRRVMMRKLMIDRFNKLRDFDGSPVRAAELADRYRVFVTPTLLFVDSQGKELAERMVGVTTLEFYGGYLDQALEVSRSRLHELQRCK
jgi:thioredoxin-related protein